jgi:hypothetical protein
MDNERPSQQDDEHDKKKAQETDNVSWTAGKVFFPRSIFFVLTMFLGTIFEYWQTTTHRHSLLVVNAVVLRRARVSNPSYILFPFYSTNGPLSIGGVFFSH